MSDDLILSLRGIRKAFGDNTVLDGIDCILLWLGCFSRFCFTLGTPR